MEELVHTWEHEGQVITFSWIGDADVVPDRVYAFAFTPRRQMLLVTDPAWAPACWLPGGGVEPGETPREALEREWLEEANAVLHDLVPLGTQRAHDSVGTVSLQTFYWCRVMVGDEFSPSHEVTERVLVEPDRFLDTLFWAEAIPRRRCFFKMPLGSRNQRNLNEP